MNNLLLVFGALLVITIIYLVERALAIRAMVSKINQLKIQIINQEKHIWNRFSLLIALRDPKDLADDALTQAREQLYLSPSQLSFVGLNAVLDRYLKLDFKTATELGLRSELKGYMELVNNKWTRLQLEIRNTRKKVESWPVVVVGIFFTKQLRSAVKFQTKREKAVVN